MVKLKKMNKLKYIIIIAILFYSFDCLSQNIKEENQKNFYVVDTITINNPVVFYAPNQSGKFVSDLKVVKSNRGKLKKLVLKNEVFIFGQDLYRFMDSDSEMKKYHYPDYGNCEFETDYFNDIKGLVYQKFKEEPKRFVLGLIRASYFNDKITTYGKKQSVFKKYNNPLYYKIVFPLCE